MLNSLRQNGKVTLRITTASIATFSIRRSSIDILNIMVLFATFSVKDTRQMTLRIMAVIITLLSAECH